MKRLIATLPTTLLMTTVLAACGKKEPAPTPPTAPPPAAEDVAAPSAADASEPGAPDAAPDPACLAQETARVLGSIDPDFARLDGGKVVLCGATRETRHCVSLDLESGQRTASELSEDDLAHLPAFPPGLDEGLVRDEARPVLKLCSAEDARCKDLHVGEVLAAHFDKDKRRVVVTSFDSGKLSAELYDAATLAAVKSLPIAERAVPDCSYAAFVGQRLLLSSGACTGGGKAWLVDPESGETVAAIGDGDVFVRDGQFTQVQGDLWAFRAASGKAVYLHDVRSGARVATVDLDQAADNTASKDDAAFVLSDGGALVLVEARPLVGTVYTIDVKDGSVTRRHVPRPCP